MSLKIETLQNQYHFIEFLDNQHSGLSNKRIRFLKAYPPIIVHVSIEGLKVKIELVNTGRKCFNLEKKE